MIRPKIIEHPSGPLLSIETLRSQCEIVAIDTDSDGVTSHPDDSLLLAYQEAAVQKAEAFLGLSVALRTLEIALDSFPSGADLSIEMPQSPVVGVVSVSYLDTDDLTETMTEDAYTVDDYQLPNWLLPASGTSWPSAKSVVNAVKIRYRAGYSSEGDADSDADALPGQIKAAILLMVDHLYRNRGASTDKPQTELPMGVQSLLRPLRVRTGFA